MAETFEAFRLAGLLLAGGGVLLVLLVGPTAFVSPAIWNGPHGVTLRLISDNGLVWRVANLGFALATIATTAGLFLMPGLVGDRGVSMAWVSAVAFVLAAVPWLVILTIRLGITPGVADGFVADGTVDPVFAPLDRLGGALFPAFILIASGSIVALGVAVVAGGSLAEPLGWACLAAGLAIGGSYLAIGDTLPAFVYFPTTAIGIALLLTND
jgi:hypothetical protein